MGCRYVNTLLKLVPKVLALQEQLREAVQNGDMETCHGICRIVVTLGENHSRCVCFSLSLYQCEDFRIHLYRHKIISMHDSLIIQSCDGIKEIL